MEALRVFKKLKNDRITIILPDTLKDQEMS